MKNAWRVLFVIGLLIALFGVGIDYLLPGASPGLNLPQLLIIAAGLLIAVGAFFLPRIQRQSSSPGRARKALLKVLVVALATLVLLEILLAAWGRKTYFPRQIPEENVREIPWGICDELGCRKHFEAVLDACARGYLSGIRCVINRDGFGDTDEFVVADDFPLRDRILIMGDSYTRGFHADVGKSYVDRLEDEMPEAVVWNVAEPGTATNQAVLSFAGIAPRLQPHLSILGFYMNDFPENLVPKDMSLRLVDDAGRQIWVTRYEKDRWGNPVTLPEDTVNAYLALGAIPPASELERLLGTTHLGTLALRTLDFVLGVGEDESFERQVRLTRQYLAQLRDQAAVYRQSVSCAAYPTVDRSGIAGRALSNGSPAVSGIENPLYGSGRRAHSSGLYRPLEHRRTPKSGRLSERMCGHLLRERKPVRLRHRGHALGR